MGMETDLLNRFAEHFTNLDIEKSTVAPRRIFLEAPERLFMDMLKYASDELGFNHLCTITGLDTGGWFEFIYHISNENGFVISLKRKTSRDNPVIASVLPIYNGAVFYEREISDLLGVKVIGLPEGRRYPLPDNWPIGQFPLRKDWAPEDSKG